MNQSCVVRDILDAEGAMLVLDYVPNYVVDDHFNNEITVFTLYYTELSIIES